MRPARRRRRKRKRRILFEHATRYQSLATVGLPSGPRRQDDRDALLALDRPLALYPGGPGGPALRASGASFVRARTVSRGATAPRLVYLDDPPGCGRGACPARRVSFH